MVYRHVQLMVFVCSIVASASFQVKKKKFQMQTNILYSNQKFAYYLYVMTQWVSNFFNQIYNKPQIR